MTGRREDIKFVFMEIFTNILKYFKNSLKKKKNNQHGIIFSKKKSQVLSL